MKKEVLGEGLSNINTCEYVFIIKAQSLCLIESRGFSKDGGDYLSRTV